MATTAVGNPYVESSDLVANYPGVSETLAERIDVVGVNPFADAAARATAIPSPVEGQMSSLADTDSVERYDGSAWVAVGPGKILQVVRATDSTNRSTTSTSFVDASISVTITPQKSTSAVLLMWGARGDVSASGTPSNLQITDSSNTAISGAEEAQIFSASGGAISAPAFIVAYDSPATTSATVYKGRFRIITGGGTFSIRNDLQTGQLYALEIGA